MHLCCGRVLRCACGVHARGCATKLGVTPAALPTASRHSGTRQSSNCLQSHTHARTHESLQGSDPCSQELNKRALGTCHRIDSSLWTTHCGIDSPRTHMRVSHGMHTRQACNIPPIGARHNKSPAHAQALQALAGINNSTRSLPVTPKAGRRGVMCMHAPTLRASCLTAWRRPPLPPPLPRRCLRA
jgi:hypothetical protein